MTKWVSIVMGVVVLTAIFLFVRFVSVSGNGFQESQHTSTNQAMPANDSALEAVAGGQNVTAMGRGSAQVIARDKVADTMAIQSPLQGQATESVERMELDTAALEPDSRGGGMPGLVILREDSEGAGAGPSQEDFGGPGPELDARDLAHAGALRQATESVPNGLKPPPSNNLPNAGPSQTDLGLPGPGEEESQATEHSRFDAGLTDDQNGVQPLPAR